MNKESLFAISLFPYLGFLCVFITIPAGIYAKIHYGQELANVDWLHGSAEFFLTLSNILVVLGFRQAILAKKETEKGEQG
ncbi:MAG: DUF3593 domain-containing protein [Microcystis sp. 53602_E8]|nr:DUF3593 domain-containing protein [Microcystis sp. 53602_E8]